MFKTIAVISGKGGTGKTIFTATLAQNLENINLVDADINAPNLSLMIPHEISREIEIQGGNFLAEVGTQCTGCKKCVEVCRFNAISMNSQNSAQIDPGLCIGCEVCSYNCPVDTIFMKQREFTKIALAQWKKGFILFPKPKTGEQVSGKLVSDLRREAERLKEGDIVRTILIDGSPGIGCHVIAAITDVDIPVVITEPTISALSDLKRITKLINYFKLPGKVVINKATLNINFKKEIIEFCKENDLEVLGEIPYYEDFFSLINNGVIPTESDNQNLKTSYLEVINKIKIMLN